MWPKMLEKDTILNSQQQEMSLNASDIFLKRDCLTNASVETTNEDFVSFLWRTTETKFFV